jgi:hypothetical protein
LDKTRQLIAALKRAEAVTAEDKRLYDVGKAYFDFMTVSWNTSEHYYLYDLAFRFWDELLKKYPQSVWSAKVEFQRIKDASYDEGGDTSGFSQAVETFKKFISRYPNSELIPHAMLEIVKRASSHRGDSHILRKDPVGETLLNEGAQYAKLLAERYPHTEQWREAAELTKSIEDQKSLMTISAEIHTEKDEFDLGEDISFLFKVTNAGKRDIALLGDQKGRFLHLVIERKTSDYSVMPCKWVTIVPPHKNQLSKVTLSSGKTIAETVSIQKDSYFFTQYPGNTELGHFLIDEAGKYQLKAFVTADAAGPLIALSKWEFKVK